MDKPVNMPSECVYCGKVVCECPIKTQISKYDCVSDILDGSDIVSHLRKIMNLPDKIVSIKLECSVDETPLVCVEFYPIKKGDINEL